MITENHWLLTTMNGEARYEKPPFPSWIGAIFGGIFGITNVWALRLPTALMGVFTIIFWYKFSLLSSQNKTVSFWSAAILATSLYFITIQKEAPSDIYHIGCMLFAVYVIFKSLKKNILSFKNLILASLGIGFAILSKSVIPLYSILLPFVISYLIVYHSKAWKKKVIWFISLLGAGILIGGWWYVYIRLKDSNTFELIALKETGNWTNYNVKPFYYYWNFFTQTGLWTIPALVSLIYPYLIKRVSNKKLYTFSWIWTVTSLVLLSIVPEKKVRYLLPVLIPLALTIALYIEYLAKHFKELRKNESWPIYLHTIILIIIGYTIPIGLLYNNLMISSTPWLWSSFLVISSIICATLMWRYLKHKLLQKVFYTSILFLTSLIVFGMPLFKILYNNPAYEKASSEVFPSNFPTYSYGEIAPEILWNFGRTAPTLTAKHLQELNQSPFGVLVRPSLSTDFETHYKQAFTLKKITTFDHNISARPNQKKYKDRLAANVYILKKRP